MKPGPRRTPTKVLEMRGSWLARKRKNTDPGYGTDAVGYEILIKMPSWLSEDAKAVWRLVVAHLKPLGIIGRMDTHALARYCTLFCEWRKATDFVQRHGQTISTKGPKDRLTIRLLHLEHEFGMTPAARASFGIDSEKANKGKRERQGKERFFPD